MPGHSSAFMPGPAARPTSSRPTTARAGIGIVPRHDDQTVGEPVRLVLHDRRIERGRQGHEGERLEQPVLIAGVRRRQMRRDRHEGGHGGDRQRRTRPVGVANAAGPQRRQSHEDEKGERGADGPGAEQGLEVADPGDRQRRKEDQRHIERIGDFVAVDDQQHGQEDDGPQRQRRVGTRPLAVARP